MFERVDWARSPEERLKIRQEKEVPIIDELIRRVNERLLDGKLLQKSKFREALGYFHGACSFSGYYFYTNLYFEMDRFGSEAGAILLSFVETCRGLEINSREYLEDIFRRLMGHKVQKLLEELLTDQWLAMRKASNNILANPQHG